MTCIVAIADKTGVYMGGDSAGVGGLSITVRDDVKVFHNGDFLIGGTTSFRMLQLLQYRLNPPKQGHKQSDMEYMVNDFIDSVRKCFADGGWGKASGHENNEGGNFLVGYNGALYEIFGDFQVAKPSLQYSSCGCGEDLALGSLYSTAGLKPEARLKKALEAATHFSAGVSAPYVFLKQPKVKK